MLFLLEYVIGTHDRTKTQTSALCCRDLRRHANLEAVTSMLMLHMRTSWSATPFKDSGFFHPTRKSTMTFLLQVNLKKLKVFEYF